LNWAAASPLHTVRHGYRRAADVFRQQYLQVVDWAPWPAVPLLGRADPARHLHVVASPTWPHCPKTKWCSRVIRARWRTRAWSEKTRLTLPVRRHISHISHCKNIRWLIGVP